jgi:hypothetical protein
VGTDDEFRRKIIDYVLRPPIEDEEIQIIEVVNVEDDRGPFPRIQQEEMIIDQTPQIMKILNSQQKKKQKQKR